MKIKDDYKALWIIGLAVVLISFILPLIDNSDSLIMQVFLIILLMLIIGGAFYWMSKL